MKTALALSFLIMQIICQQLPPFVGQPKFQIDNQIFPIPNNLEYPPTGAKLVDERTAQVSSAIDVFINANIKMWPQVLWHQDGLKQCVHPAIPDGLQRLRRIAQLRSAQHLIRPTWQQPALHCHPAE